MEIPGKWSTNAGCLDLKTMVNQHVSSPASLIHVPSWSSFKCWNRIHMGTHWSLAWCDTTHLDSSWFNIIWMRYDSSWFYMLNDETLRCSIFLRVKNENHQVCQGTNPYLVAMMPTSLVNIGALCFKQRKLRKKYVSRSFDESFYLKEGSVRLTLLESFSSLPWGLQAFAIRTFVSLVLLI